MLRMNHSNDELEYFFGKVDKEFQLLENVIKTTLEKISTFEKPIQVGKQE